MKSISLSKKLLSEKTESGKAAADCRKTTALSKKTERGEAADSFFASFLGSKKEVGNGGKAPNKPT